MNKSKGRYPPCTARSERTSIDGEREGVRADASMVGTVASDAGGSIPSAIFHAFRRRRPWAIGLGGLCSLAAVALVIALRPPMFTATSLIHIAERKPSLVFETEAPGSKGDGREFRLAQEQLVRSRSVAETALASASATCPSLCSDRLSATAWLAKSLEVGFPSGTQTMVVKLKGAACHQVGTCVDAVVQAYVNLVNEQEQMLRNRHLADLARVYSEREREVRDKRRQLQGMLVRNGMAASVGPSSEWQIAMNRLTEVHRELLRYGSMLEDVRGEIAVRQANADREDRVTVIAEELRHLARSDQEFLKLSTEHERIAVELTHLRSTATAGALERIEGPYIARQERLKTRMDLRKAELEKQACDADRLAALDRIRTLQQEAILAERRVQQLEENAKQWRQKLEKMNPSAVAPESVVETEMLESEIRQLDRVLSRIAEDREQELVELSADDRVRVVQEAEVSGAADRASRLFLAGASGFVAFVLPVLGVLIWDLRQRLIGCPREIWSTLRIDLLGTVPKASGSRPHMPMPWLRQNNNQPSFAEATDTITVRLLREAQIEDKRVIAVCSSAGDEGRQALASQIARSFARSDQRTVLVDGNLRHPSLHSEFDAPCEPGVSSLLTGSDEVPEVLRETAVPNLWFVPAGQWSQHVRAGLANGNFGPLLEEILGLFDLVVIDTGAILAGIDARYLCQYADTVVLSVMRDGSRASDLHVARSALQSLGVGQLSAVMCGATEAEQYDLSAPAGRDTSAWAP